MSYGNYKQSKFTLKCTKEFNLIKSKISAVKREIKICFEDIRNNVGHTATSPSSNIRIRNGHFSKSTTTPTKLPITFLRSRNSENALLCHYVLVKFRRVKVWATGSKCTFSFFAVHNMLPSG